MPETPFLILWIVAGLLFFSMCIPPLFHFLGWSRYRLEVQEGEPGPEPGDDAPYTARLLTQLRGLGFQPLGELTETVNFFAYHWSWSCRQRVWAAKEKHAFAILYHFVEGEPERLSFATGFDDGALVWTGNHSEDIRLLTPDHVRWGKATDDLAELLELHHRAADRLGGGDRQPIVHDSVAGLARVLEPHSRRYLSADKLVPLTFLFLIVFVGGILPTMVWLFKGLASHWVPLAIIFVALVYWFFHIRGMAAAIGRQRRAEVEDVAVEDE